MWRMAKRASARAAASPGGFFLLAKPEGLAKPQVQSKPRRARPLVNWNSDLPRLYLLVETAIHGGYHSRTAARA